MTEPTNAPTINVTLIDMGGGAESVSVPEGSTLGQLIDKAIADHSAVDVKHSSGSSDRETPLSDGDTVNTAPKKGKHGA